MLELARNYLKCQDIFAQHNIIRLLINHLAFETIQEHNKYAIASIRHTSIHVVVMANNDSKLNNMMKAYGDDDKQL